MRNRRVLRLALVSLGAWALTANAVRAGADDPKDAAVLAKLEEPVPLDFQGAPLQNVLKFIKSAGQGPDDNGIPIHVDPDGLEAAGATMATPITVRSKDGETLKSSLKRMLKSVNLAFKVKGGLLTITGADPEDGPGAGGAKEGERGPN